MKAEQVKVSKLEQVIKNNTYEKDSLTLQYEDTHSRLNKANSRKYELEKEL